MALMASLQLPLVLSKLSYLIDNPWNVSLTRANAAGLILADSLMDRNLGKRPVTLLGFSLGSRVIFSCLKELADKGQCGLVENVYLFGSPIVANKNEYLKARSVVSGAFVNGYSKNDWILGYLFRATSGGIMRVAGLAPVKGVPHLENIDCTSLVDGHMAYRVAMPRLLREVGWEVVSEEFDEIENPDPDNHAERQRELIREIEEARKEAEQEKPADNNSDKKKKGFRFFGLGKSTKKPSNDPRGSVLFDTDAMKAEVAAEEDMNVKQLDTTLPSMKVDNVDSNTTKPRGGSSLMELAPPPPTRTRTASGGRSSGDSPPYTPLDMTIKRPQRSYSSSLQRSSGDFSEPGFSRSQRSLSLAPLTLPSGIGLHAPEIEHNVWADEGHHDEDDIQMSFE